MEDAIGEEKEPRNLTLRVLAVNFAAIHTTSMVSHLFLTRFWLTLDSRPDLYIRPLPVTGSVSHAVKFRSVLTVFPSPQYIEPLREEVESIVKEQGWTKASIFNMRKLDSFLREAQRLHGFNSGKDHPPNCRGSSDTDASQLQ